MLVHRETALHLLLATIAQFQCLLSCHIFLHITQQKIDRNLILAALKEAVFNGVSNLRYIDKILYEWNKKGIKKTDDIKKRQVEEKDKKDIEASYEYDWLNDE